jgi:gliding motility-associated lipoprotein GldD
MMRPVNKIKLLIIPVLAGMLTGCHEIAVPKPKGYFRIDLPSRKYITFDPGSEQIRNLPVTFEYPAYGKVLTEPDPYSGTGWFNIEMPIYHAKIYLTYIGIRNDLDSLLEQNYNINIKSHITKADAIDEQVINDPARKVYGILYDLKGNTATAVQFFVTDSTKHYLRGSLYFDAEPNPDSLAPVVEFFRDDIIHLIETLEWKDK